MGNSRNRLLQVKEIPSDKAAIVRSDPTILAPLLELLELLGLLELLTSLRRVLASSRERTRVFAGPGYRISFDGYRFFVRALGLASRSSLIQRGCPGLLLRTAPD